jgi:hypothetical protein
MLFDMTDGFLAPVPLTTFAAEGVLERTHLQRALRDHIEVLGEGLLVVGEEFGDFQDSRRRIDLLCVDHAARLVVVELKRTEDGGHMELQALRYAAMVSAMTFEQLADIKGTRTRTHQTSRRMHGGCWPIGLRMPVARTPSSAEKSGSFSRRPTLAAR